MIEKKTVASELAKQNKNEEEIMKSLNIGAIAKKKRLELHLSQKEVSDEICSISYLSKIETNKIIPNATCLNLLMERINLSKYDVYLLENFKEIILKELKDIYFCDDEALDELYYEISDVKNNQYADVLRLGYYVYHKNTIEAKTIIDSNMKLLTSMDGYYLKSFSLFACEYLLQTHKYEEANKMLEQIIKTDPVGEFYKILVKDFSFRLYQEEKRHVLAAKLYNELIEYYSKNVHIKRTIETQLTFLRMLFEEEEYSEVVQSALNSTMCVDLFKSDEFNYIVGTSLVRTKKEFLAKEYFERINKDSKYLKLAINDIYKCSVDKDEFILNIEKENEDNPNFYFQYFLDKYYMRLDRSIFEGELYKDAITLANQEEKIALLKLERDYLLDISRYKEANYISNKIIDLLKGTKTIK